jgi:dTDP-4-dehydrorhamnose reductase
LNILVLGASGMLGNAVLRFFGASPGYSTVGAIRSSRSMRLLPKDLQAQLVCVGDVENANSMLELFGRVRPDVVVNCVGLVKQVLKADDVLAAVSLNSLLPHRLVRLCRVARARLIHVSTDCVFAGTKGMYREQDAADAKDLYGISKLLGEVDEDGAVTLRTSYIGPELASAHGLLSWFLAQSGRVKGFTRAIYSGLPTVELARVMRDFVIPNAQLRGLHHVSAEPISKYDLLTNIARVYGLSVDIEPDAELVIDRSLDSTSFRTLTGYVPPAWPELVRHMHQFG